MIKYQELEWQEARKKILPLNQKLCEIIDAISPDHQYTMYKMTYRFGDEVLQRAELYLPTEKNHLLPLKSPEISNKLKEDLGYNWGSNPIGLLLKNSVELFIKLEDRVIPYAIISPGNVFGTWRILDTELSHCPKILWEMTAGARSIFMLPKISETSAHNRLNKKFQLKLEKPNHLGEHWEIFRELAGHQDLEEPWGVEFLFFSKKWFDNLHDSAWEKFKLYLLDRAWQGSSYWRNQYIWNFVFSLIQENRNLKTPAYISNIVKHLLAMSVGVLPGFRPALNESLAPIKLLQSIYVEHYGLKKHLPIIMQPEYFSAENPSPIYYSLQYPTTMEFAPKTTTRNSTLTDEFLVNSQLKKVLEEIGSGRLSVTDTPLEKIPEKINFDFFHNNVGWYRDLRESSEITMEDSAFAATYKCVEDKTFPKNSTFLNGCVRISQKSE